MSPRVSPCLGRDSSAPFSTFQVVGIVLDLKPRQPSVVLPSTSSRQPAFSSWSVSVLISCAQAASASPIKNNRPIRVSLFIVSPPRDERAHGTREPAAEHRWAAILYPGTCDEAGEAM